MYKFGEQIDVIDKYKDDCKFIFIDCLDDILCRVIALSNNGGKNYGLALHKDEIKKFK